MKKNKGITLISLIITILVITILASTAIYSGVTTINSAKLTAFETELKIMQSEVNDLYEKYRSGETILIDSVETNILDLGEAIVGTEADGNIATIANETLTNAEVANDSTIRTDYRYFTKEYIEKLGVEGINQDFLLNIKSRKVVSYLGFEYEGVRYYTLEQLSNEVYNVEYLENENIPRFKTNISQIENGKWKLSINDIQYEGNIEKWKVKYQLEDWDYWAESDSLEIIIKEEGIYNIYINNGEISSNEEKIEIKNAKVIDTSGANPPDLKDGMIAITFNADGSDSVVEDATTRDWYNYAVQEGLTDTYNEETGEWGTSHWANAKLNENYYVWIPRYAYKIDKSVTYTTQDGGTSHKIDVIFVDENNKKADGTEIEGLITDYTEVNDTKNSTTNYILHPAFTFGEKTLSGIWVGKYESSNDGNGNVKIIPNATSYTGIDVATMFTKSQALSTKNNDAHMMKNVEWGAVVYLAQSQYGRNGTEISVNQCSQMITGAGKTEGKNLIYESSYYSADPTAEQQYNGKIGKLSSTTGNIYGVYDMSGGAEEYVMGFHGKAEDTPPLGLTGFTTSTIPERKYYDLYINKTSVDSSNIGDALYETEGWNSDSAVLVNSSSPVFRRGGNYGNTFSDGAFYFYNFNGSGYGSGSFRVCLVVQ